MQACDRAQDRGEHQRHHDHLQQLYVAVADDVKPLNGRFQGRVVCAIDSMQHAAEYHADHQTDQYFFCQTPLTMAGLRQQQQ